MWISPDAFFPLLCRHFIMPISTFTFLMVSISYSYLILTIAQFPFFFINSCQKLLQVVFAVHSVSTLPLRTLFNGPWLLRESYVQGKKSHCSNANQRVRWCTMRRQQAAHQHNTTNQSFGSLCYRWRHVYTSTEYLLNTEVKVENCLYEEVGKMKNAKWLSLVLNFLQLCKHLASCPLHSPVGTKSKGEDSWIKVMTV